MIFVHQVSAGGLRHNHNRHHCGLLAGVWLSAGHGLHRQAACGQTQRESHRGSGRQPADVRCGCGIQKSSHKTGEAAASSSAGLQTDPGPDSDPKQQSSESKSRAFATS